MGSAFDHSPSITVPSSSTNNRIVTWNGSTGKNFNNTALVEIAAGVVTGITSLSVDNIQILDNAIVSTNSNGNIGLTPNGSGAVVISKLQVTSSGAQDGYVLTSTDGNGNVAWEEAGGGAIAATSGGADTYLARYTNGTSLIGSNKLTFTESSADFNINLSSANPYFRITSYSTNDAHEPYLELRKSGHGTIGSTTAMSNGEQLGTIAWAGSTSGGFVLGAKIYVKTNAPFDGNQEDAKMYFAVKNGTSWKDVLTVADNTGTHPSYETEGVVGIGETSPVAKLHVKRGESGVDPYGRLVFFEDSGDECYIQIAGGGSSPTGGLLMGNSSSVAACGIYMHGSQLDFRFAGSHKARFASGGAVYFYSLGTGSANDIHMSSNQIIQVVSSRRYKKDEKDFSLDSKLLQQLVIKDFTWKEDTGTPNKADFGVIAEDTYDICPALVGMIEIDGEMVPDSVPSRPLLMMAVAEIQRLHTEIELLKS